MGPHVKRAQARSGFRDRIGFATNRSFWLWSRFPQSKLTLALVGLSGLWLARSADRHDRMALNALTISPLICALGAVQIFGIVAASIARLTEGTSHERSGQWLCLIALAAVGIFCGAALQYGPDAGAACAVTLALMTMIAVVDFRSAA